MKYEIKQNQIKSYLEKLDCKMYNVQISVCEHRHIDTIGCEILKSRDKLHRPVVTTCVSTSPHSLVKVLHIERRRTQNQTFYHH